MTGRFDAARDDLIVAVGAYLLGRRLRRRPPSADRVADDALLAAAEALVHAAGRCSHCTAYAPVLDVPLRDDHPRGTR